MVTRAKRRYKSQRIGKDGELIFERWATRNHLSANKQFEDFGIDYHCQEFAPVGQKSEEVTGRTLLVQVRATSGDSRARVTLSREDVETALRQEALYCLIGVHMAVERVHFRFLDVELANEWAAFLAGTNDSTSIRIDKMETDPGQFLEKLRRVSRPAFVLRLAEAKARLAMNRDLPGADFRLNAGMAGDWALVRLPLLGRAFDVREGKELEELAGTVFNLGAADGAYSEATRRFALRPSVARIAELTDGPVFLAAGLEQSVTLVLNGPEGQVSAEAKLRHAGDERAYLLPCGLVLRVSDARKKSDGTHAHDLSFEVKSDGAASLGATTDLAFLKGLQAGALVNEAGRDGIPVETFGVQRLGSSIVAIERVCAEIGVPLSEVELSDLGDYAFSYNLGFLEAMLLKQPRPIPVRAFVLGLKPSEKIQEDAWTPCFYRVPFVLRFKGRNLVLWLSGLGDAYVPDGLVQGFRLGPPDVVNVELVDFEAPGNGVAAAYFADGWAPVPIDAERGFTFDGTAAGVPVVGEYRWSDGDDAESLDAN
jgi:hypothetical protein